MSRTSPTTNDNYEQVRLIDLGDVYSVEVLDFAPRMIGSLFDIPGKSSVGVSDCRAGITVFLMQAFNCGGCDRRGGGRAEPSEQ